jgi:hypothetical protein
MGFMFNSSDTRGRPAMGSPHWPNHKSIRTVPRLWSSDLSLVAWERSSVKFWVSPSSAYSGHGMVFSGQKTHDSREPKGRLIPLIALLLQCRPNGHRIFPTGAPNQVSEEPTVRMRDRRDICVYRTGVGSR